MSTTSHEFKPAAQHRTLIQLMLLSVATAVGHRRAEGRDCSGHARWVPLRRQRSVVHLVAALVGLWAFASRPDLHGKSEYRGAGGSLITVAVATNRIDATRAERRHKSCALSMLFLTYIGRRGAAGHGGGEVLLPISSQ